MNTLKRRWKVAAILAAVLLLHGLANGYWISRDQTLRGNDMGPHIQGVAIAHSWIAQEGLVGGVARVSRGKSPIYWPSAGYLIWGTPALIFGHSIDAQRNYNLLFLALMAAALLLMGRRLHSWRAGLLAAALIPLYPGVMGEGRQVGVDFPGAAMVTVCMALLLSIRCFAATKRSVALGVWVGLATLVRPHADFFLAAPMLLALVWGLARPVGVSRKKVVINGLLSLAAVLLVTSVWWFGNLEEIVANFVRHQDGYGFARKGSSFLFYLRALVLSASPFLLGVSGVSLVMVGIHCWHERKVERGSGSMKSAARTAMDSDSKHNCDDLPGAVPGASRFAGGAVPGASRFAEGAAEPLVPNLFLLVAWMIGGVGILSQIQVHMLRYLLPLLPALALVTAVGLMSLRHRALRRVAVGAVLLGAGVAWLFDTVDLVGLPLPQVRPLTVQKIDKEEPYVPAGIPLNNLYMGTLDRAARKLRALHGTGEGVLLRLVLDGRPDNDPRHVDDITVRWAAGPILGVALPGMRITEHRFPEYILHRPPNGSRDELINFTSIHYPDRPTPIRHCYTMRMFPSTTPAPAGDASCRRVLDLRDAMSPTEERRPLRLTIYHYPQCSLSLCATEGREPRDP